MFSFLFLFFKPIFSNIVFFHSNLAQKVPAMKNVTLFKKKEEELYLVTNYKVMYSTLMKQQSLERVYPPFSNKIISKMCFARFGLTNTKFYLLLRNPYFRLESFFKDKFRKVVKVSEREGKWQLCQKIFFPQLGLDTSMPLSEISKRLLETSFSEFISMLPHTYKKDGHLHPQYWSIYMTIFKKVNVKLPISFQKVYKMESEKDIGLLANIFDLNLGIKANSTKSMNISIEWTSKELEIVEKIYGDDFRKFNYKKRS